jgi:L-fuculose-phosphate aldolase
MSDSIIRYQVDKTPSPLRTEAELRAEIAQICRMMWQRGYVAANDGNVTARLDGDRFLCTPSGLSKGLVEPDQIVIVDWEGNLVDAHPQSKRPTSEILLHLEAYRQRPDVKGVVHAHPPMAIALSTAGISLAHTMIPDVVLGLGLIPTVVYATPASVEGADSIREVVRSADAMVLPRHGSVTVGGSPLEAYYKLEKLEQTALITGQIHALGGAASLDGQEIEKLIGWRNVQGVMHPGQEEMIRRASS